VLTRGASAEGNPRHVTWNPSELGDWVKALDGVDAVVRLIGEQAIGVRYSEARKRRIRDSRVIPTESLVRALAAAAVKPAVLVSASGINYYGAARPRLSRGLRDRTATRTPRGRWSLGRADAKAP
jgi:NAD dependent epimerase/dehydratase family enzyme